MEQDTIVAVATPPGAGGIGVVRLSGPDAVNIADAVVRIKRAPMFYQSRARRVKKMFDYTCAYGRAWDAEGEIDEVIVTVFVEPHSYTGENVAEISGHGSAYLLNRIVRACCAVGARLARPGEFTKRAFLNGKLDLTRAEAVADLIAAQGKQAARAALSARDGALYRKIDGICNMLMEQSAHLDAWIDYPEEGVEAVEGGRLRAALAEAGREMDLLLGGYDTGRMVREGIETAIVGRPNVGKSTLMNLLSGYERSIVAEIAGTTRDVVTDTVRLGDLVLRLSDTAGIRRSQDPVERVGVERAERELERAQLVLAMFDGSEALSEDDRRVIGRCRGSTCIALVNKNDLPQKLNCSELEAEFTRVLTISARAEDGARRLREVTEELFGLGAFDGAAAMLANERQRQAVADARKELGEALEALDAGMSYDAVGVCLDGAIDRLLELTGRKASQEVVDRVFERFCVGK